jgi:5,10-methylenetetrahydromethanopterin reductase
VPTPRVHFGLVRPIRDIPEFLDWAEYADGAGYELTGFGDSQTLWADPHAMMAATAQRTKRMLLGPTVTNPITRHPTVAANAIMTIQKMSGGRAFFGIGPGDSAVYNIGAKHLPRKDFEEYALAVKGLCAGQEVSYRGGTFKLFWDTTPVPLWVAGDGPRMLELAGRIADGVIAGGGGTPEMIEHGLRHLRVGAESVGRNSDDIPVWFMVRVLVAPTEAEGIEKMRFYMAGWLNAHFRRSPTEKGLTMSPEIEKAIRGVQSEYRGSEHVKPGSTFNADLVVKYGLVEWVAERFAVTGPPDRIIRKLEDLIAAGARNFILPQVLPDAMTTTREIAEKILPAFR